MSILVNDESNISLEIQLINGENVDIDFSRSNYQNWIPFDLNMNINGESINYAESVPKTFSVGELQYLIDGLKRKVTEKRHSDELKDFVYVNTENLFELKIYDTGETDLLYVETWFNMGTLTNGDVYGFSKGFKFIVTIESIISFLSTLESQFDSIVKTAYDKYSIYAKLG